MCSWNIGERGRVPPWHAAWKVSGGPQRKPCPRCHHEVPENKPQLPRPHIHSWGDTSPSALWLKPAFRMELMTDENPVISCK